MTIQRYLATEQDSQTCVEDCFCCKDMICQSFYRCLDSPLVIAGGVSFLIIYVLLWVCIFK